MVTLFLRAVQSLLCLRPVVWIQLEAKADMRQ